MAYLSGKAKSSSFKGLKIARLERNLFAYYKMMGKYYTNLQIVTLMKQIDKDYYEK